MPDLQLSYSVVMIISVHGLLHIEYTQEHFLLCILLRKTSMQLQPQPDSLVLFHRPNIFDQS